MPFDPASEWHSAYLRLGGQKFADDFDRATRIFIATTRDAYIYGKGDRLAAVERCMQDVPCDIAEFTRTFIAIDSVTPYA